MERRAEPGCFRVRPSMIGASRKHPTCTAPRNPGTPYFASLHPGYDFPKSLQRSRHAARALRPGHESVLSLRIMRSTCAAILLLAGMFAAEAQTPGDPAQKGSPVSISSDVIKELAPAGKLRAAINLGNPVLAQGTPEAPRGVTVDLAHELARRTGLTLELVSFTAAGKVF